MAYDEAGSGEPLVLLHSGVCDRRMWQPQWESLSQSFRVVRPDLRGFGETPLPPGRFSFVGDVVELLDHLSIERACVVGSSLGGRVALELAVTVPERVKRLVLLCPAFQGLEPTPAAVAFDEAEDAFLEGGDVDGFVELNVSTWLGPEADERTRDQVRLMQRRALELQLAAEQGPEPPQLEYVEVDPAAISAPALVVSGRHDMDHFQAIADHLAETMPNARLLRLDWAGHLPSLERPEPVTELIAESCG
jgi:pimeloyl-ACP methyl ester carboxylesterase